MIFKFYHTIVSVAEMVTVADSTNAPYDYSDFRLFQKMLARDMLIKI